MNEEEVKKIQAWIDNRLGVPNTFNIKLLTDFLEFARYQLSPKSPDDIDEPKPDEELGKVIDKQMESAYFVGKNCIGFPPEVKARIRREILLKAASIKDAECQKRVEGIFQGIELAYKMYRYAKIDGTRKEDTFDIWISYEWWQALKKGVK